MNTLLLIGAGLLAWCALSVCSLFAFRALFSMNHDIPRCYACNGTGYLEGEVTAWDIGGTAPKCPHCNEKPIYCDDPDYCTYADCPTAFCDKWKNPLKPCSKETTP